MTRKYRIIHDGSFPFYYRPQVKCWWGWKNLTSTWIATIGTSDAEKIKKCERIIATHITYSDDKTVKEFEVDTAEWNRIKQEYAQ